MSMQPPSDWRMIGASGKSPSLPSAPYPPINPPLPLQSQSQQSKSKSQFQSTRRSVSNVGSSNSGGSSKDKRDNPGPVAVSPRDGRIAHASGRTLWVGPTDQGPSAMESPNSRPDEDISATMMRRARCSRKCRYSMDVNLNLEMLTEELAGSSDVALRNNVSLCRLWKWIRRVEENMYEGDLLDSGVWQLLRLDANPDESLVADSALRCPVFESPERKRALDSCGWAGTRDLAEVLEECELWERTAALAVWHGDVGAAVEALQRASKRAREETSSSHYAETLDLVAMCIAGYGGSSESSSQVWKGACETLLKRDDLQVDGSVNSRVAYLRSLCRFLMNAGTPEGLTEVLDNADLSMCDRIAFACRYLDDVRLPEHLSKCVEACQKSGDLEGLIITSLSKDGIRIIMSYVDETADVQTAALLVSRTIFPSNWTWERRVCTEWVESYRDLLNTWQLWQSRAMFDVDRAEVLRRAKMRSAELGRTSSSGGNRRGQPSSRRSGPRSTDPDVVSAIPAQLDVRCNFCSSSLGLRRHEGVASQWLSKMKPVLSCCPHCRKPLPRCAICLLSLGALNPYMEFARERSRSIRGAPSPQPPDDLSALSNLPFAEWFSWCMYCKHGGHAHHMVGWFANHEECPVSGCSCRCQFDGIHKLNRPNFSIDR